MASQERLNLYEELRQANVKRNEEYLRQLGLLQSGCEDEEVRSCGKRPRTSRASREAETGLQRSRRIAELVQPLGDVTSSVGSLIVLTSAVASSEEGAQHYESVKNFVLDAKENVKKREVQPSDINMDSMSNMEEGYSTNSSSDSFDEAHVEGDAFSKDEMTVNADSSKYPVIRHGIPTAPVTLDVVDTQFASTFGAQLQEFVMRAVMQSVTASMGPSAALVPGGGGTSSGSPLLCTQAFPPASTWNESTFNKAEARRSRKGKMLRTSVGENSDSQADVTIPENETPQQKSLRARRLNRSRCRRARELSNNRRAQKMLPHVIHVDGSGKAKGIHRHQWRAAIHGQCGRLDPSLDNINHHPKHLVNSIWHALEKKWEFQGFSHRAREMFERSATKFMRNRKMQLKYKLQKAIDGKKPNDVSRNHWSKIMDVSKKSSEGTASTVSVLSTLKGKEIVSEDLEEEEPSPLQLLWSEERIEDGSLKTGEVNEGVDSGNDDVEAKIRNLQSELLRLQNSRKIYSHSGEEATARKSRKAVEGIPSAFRMKDDMKENAKPRNLNDKGAFGQSSRQEVKRADSEVEGQGFNAVDESKKSAVLQELKKFKEDESTADTREAQMGCGDVVRLFAQVNGIEKEIAKGIVMGLAGSKIARKVIPQGWRCVKVTSYTCYAGSVPCPYPNAWTEQVKQLSVKEASGRSIVWPDSLLHTLLAN